MEPRRKATFYALAAILFWSTVATAFKLALGYVDQFQLLFLSSGVSALAIMAIMGRHETVAAFRELTVKNSLHSILLGALNPFLYYLILFKAYSILPAQEAMTLNYSWPVMLVLLSIPLLGQKAGWRGLLAIMISFTGILVIATHGDPTTFRFSDPFGDGLALGSSIIWALFWIFNVRDPREEKRKLFFNFLVGFILSGISLVLFSEFPRMPWQGWLGVVYVGLFEMGITFVFWLKALQLAPSTAKVGQLVFLSPFLSLFFIHFVIGEPILLSTFAGLLFIVAGILIKK